MRIEVNFSLTNILCWGFSVDFWPASCLLLAFAYALGEDILCCMSRYFPKLVSCCLTPNQAEARKCSFGFLAITHDCSSCCLLTVICWEIPSKMGVASLWFFSKVFFTWTASHPIGLLTVLHLAFLFGNLVQDGSLLSEFPWKRKTAVEVKQDATKGRCLVDWSSFGIDLCRTALLPLQGNMSEVGGAR